MPMLDALTMGSAVVLMLYALYAAWLLVPHERITRAIALNVLAGLVGLIANEAWMRGVPWPCGALIIALAVTATIWRREAKVFVKAYLGSEPTGHPMRRASDLQTS